MLYDDLQQLASEILSDPDFQQGTINLISITPGVGDPWKPNADTETIVPLTGVARGVKSKYVTQGLAIASDIQCTFPVPPVLPKQADYIELDGDRYKIVQLMPVPPIGTTVTYITILRKGG